ncbi:acyl-CoA dehydrogenase/oxidase [Xylogone sp. PMI_703]|nr:acyl-CoA dehydrogenase/oxidase [Xylogone sp. PMI_703]
MTSNRIVPFSDPQWHYTPNHPFYKESHRKLQRWVRQYVETNIIPHAEEWEAKGYIPEEAFKRHAQLGFLVASCYPIPHGHIAGIQLPAGIDEHEWDTFHDDIVIDEIARCGYLGVVWGINGGASTGSAPLIAFGTEEQKENFLDPLLRGNQRHCLGITEPGTGSDVAGITTTAVKSADGQYYIVNGMKKWITQGMRADIVLTAVRTGDKGGKGISLLLIPMKSEGLSRRKMINSGVSASGSAFLEFDDVKVPVGNLLGKENQGFKIIMATFNRERLWIATTAIRLARVAFSDSYNYAHTRMVFGQPLFSNQLIRAKFSKMAGLIEGTYALKDQILQLQALNSHADDQMLSVYVSLLKYRAARDLEKISREAQQVLGGAGYSRGGNGGRIEQISRDVRVLVKAEPKM